MPGAPPLNPITQQVFQTFSRLSVPPEHETMQGVISDIYNKIQAVQAGSQTVQAQIPTTAAITQIAQSVAIPASAAVLPTALNAIVPIVLAQPNSTSPLRDQNGNVVTAVDGAVVAWNIGGADAGVFYQFTRASAVWSYVSGYVARQQNQLATLAGLLGPSDTGLLVDVTDYAHILKWTGTAWTYADPSDPAGRIEMFLVDPNPVTGWHLCDGTANVPYLKFDGTTPTQTLPDLISTTAKAAYAKLGSPVSGSPVAATAPTFTGNAQTFTTTPAAAFVSGSQVDAFTAPNPYTPTGSVSATGEPRNIVLRPWFRT